MTRAKQTKTNTIIETEELDIELIKAMYQRTKRAINRSADRIEDATLGADEKELSGLEKNLFLHSKMLTSLIQMEGGLNANQSTSKPIEIDLDAARSEIIERLSRIRAAS